MHLFSRFFHTFLGPIITWRASPASTSIGLLFLIFLSVNIAASFLLRQARIDLTENQLYTLSAGSRDILNRIAEPIHLDFYYSQALSSEAPALRMAAQRVRDLLDEIVTASRGQISLTVIDPEPFSDTEDMAISRGLVGRPLPSGELFYFGLVGTNRVDSTEVISTFPREREQYLEYDLIRMIDNLNTPRKPVLGVMSNLPLDTGAGGLLAAMRGQSQPFLIYSELIDRFTVEFLPPDVQKIPNKIDVLLLAHPRPLNEPQVYAVDQFIMRGGRLIAFIDPYSEVSLTAGPNGAPLQGYTEQSSLPQLLAHWGVRYRADEIVADKTFAQRVAAGGDARRQLVDYVLWMGLGPSAFNKDDVVLSNIDLINIGSVGHFTFRPDPDQKGLSFTPLMSSSPDSMLIPRDTVVAGPRPDDLLRDFVPSKSPFVIAGRLHGALRSAFDGPPEAVDTSASFIDRNDHANIILVADSDFFDDRFWVTEQVYLGQRFAVPMADNAKFLMNAVENMMGSDALISLRGRERAVRSFARVDAIRRQAEAQYLAEEQALYAQIEAAQQELDRLERSSAVGNAAEDVRKQYRLELQDARKALRQVQGNLRRDIDRLGTSMRWLNIALVPIVILMISLIVMWRRRQRRQATQKSGGFHMVGDGQ